MLYNLPIELFEMVSYKLVDSKKSEFKETFYNIMISKRIEEINFNFPVNKLFYLLIIKKNSVSRYITNLRVINPVGFVGTNLESKINCKIFWLIKQIIIELVEELNGWFFEDYLSYGLDIRLNLFYEHMDRYYGLTSKIIMQLILQIMDLIFRYTYDKVLLFYDKLNIDPNLILLLQVFFYDISSEVLVVSKDIPLYYDLRYEYIFTFFMVRYIMDKSVELDKNESKYYGNLKKLISLYYFNHFRAVLEGGGITKRRVNILLKFVRSDKDKELMKKIFDGSIDHRRL